VKHPRALGATLAVLTLTLAACGGDGSDAANNPSQTTIEVTMADNSFTPSEITVPKGEKVTFTFTNEGALEHEALIGTEADQDEHGQEMSGGGDMGDHNMDGDMGHGAMSDAMTVAPGETASKTMTFDESGTYLIGCHVPGHYEAGMKATITVE
jgi:uncharacterized cupredoxin-like copper-binding protein